MARVTANEVKVVLPSSTTLTDVQLTAAIDAATCVVDDIAAGCAKFKSVECLRQVELYLSAHYASVTENTLSIKSEKDSCCDASVTYGFKFGEGVMGTPFGQMANTLSGGCLKSQDVTHARLFSIGSI